MTRTISWPVRRSAETAATVRVLVWTHVLITITTLVALTVGHLPGLLSNDVWRYVRIASGGQFWSAQPVEFPPLSAAFIWLTARWPAPWPLVLVPAANLGLDLATSQVILRTWGQRAALRYLALASLLLPLTLFRVDHLSVLLAVLGLSALTRDRQTGAGLLLAAGAMAKLWPGAVVVAADRTEARFVGTAIAAGAACVAVWIVVFGVDAPLQVLTFRGSVGWQIESVTGSTLRAFTGAPAIFENGAWRAGAPAWWATAGLVVVGLAIFAMSRRVEEVARRRVALVAGFLVTSPLLSPQFLLWLVPLVAVLPDDVRGRQSRLLAGAVALSMLVAVRYAALVDGSVWAMGVLIVRNGLLVAMVVAALQVRPQGVGSSDRGSGRRKVTPAANTSTDTIASTLKAVRTRGRGATHLA